MAQLTLPARQHLIHQIQALCRTHLRPSSDFARGAEASQAIAAFMHGAHAGAGREYGWAWLFLHHAARHLDGFAIIAPSTEIGYGAPARRRFTVFQVLVASPKGGCGKSTVATHLAAWFALRGKNTALLDADPQGSGLAWCAQRPVTSAGVLGIKKLRGDWQSQLPRDTQCVVIDTPAGWGADQVAACLPRVHALVIPCLPSFFDLQATQAFVQAISRLPAIARGKTPAALVANRLKPWTVQSQSGIEALQQLPVPLVAQLRDSTGYAVACGLGKSIFDFSSEQVRSHQEDWKPLLRWLRRSE